MVFFDKNGILLPSSNIASLYNRNKSSFLKPALYLINGISCVLLNNLNMFSTGIFISEF